MGRLKVAIRERERGCSVIWYLLAVPHIPPLALSHPMTGGLGKRGLRQKGRAFYYPR
jgi:hypothetical protein